MYDDQPPFGADDRCRAAFFGAHPLARSVLGTVASIQGLPVDAMREYHRRRYAPGTMVLAASGAVDFPALVAAARRLCGDWAVEPGDRSVTRGPGTGGSGQSPAPVATAVERIVRPSAALEYVVRMSAGPDENHADRFAAKLLAVILGDGSGSRLYWALVDPGLAEQASCHHHDFLDAGLFTTQLSCDAADAESALARIVDIYATAAREGIAADEFARARNKLASRVVLSGERPRRRLFDVGLEWSHCANYRTVRDNLRIVESLTLDDVHRVLATWPLAGAAATVLAGPDGDASEGTGGEA